MSSPVAPASSFHVKQSSGVSPASGPSAGGPASEDDPAPENHPAPEDKEQTPEQPPLPSPRRFWLQLVVPLLAVVLATAPGCTTGVNPISGNTRAYGYSWEQEKELGAQADEQIQAQYGVYDDEEVLRYVRRIGQDVLEESHMRRPSTPEKFRETEFTFRVLDSEIVNAFALPGGYVYVTRGLMAHLNNEAQLAVVLGHEVAHVAGRHASKQAAKQQLAQLGLVLGAVGGEALGLPGGSILQLGGQAAQFLFLRYSRDNEREADNLGVEYAAMAGYEASEGAAFFRSLERIQEQSGQSLPNFLSTHPDPGQREQRIQELADQWRGRLSTPMTTVDQEAYYQTLRGMVFGANPRQGFAEGGTFYHPELAFRFPVPENYRVVNQAQQVALVAPEQEAYVALRIADANSPESAADEFAGQDGLEVEERGRDRVNGLEARTVRASAETQQGQTLRVLAYFIQHDGRVYSMQGVTQAASFSTYRPTFEQTMGGFRPLNDPDILNVQPTRLAIRPAQQRALFESFVDASALPRGMDAGKLAIINQLQLDEPVDPGRPLKLPGS
jgi:predicted Zn-dependent protease